MNPRRQALLQALRQRRAVKVIAGIANFDRLHVQRVTQAATIARATAVDVAARPDIVSAVRAMTDLPVFVSCIRPDALIEAAAHGADVLEIGNYDALYEEGLFLTPEEVLNIARKTLAGVDSQDVMTCVTIPGHLSLDTQLSLAERLAAMGVDMLQTEGAARVVSAQPTMKALSAEEKFEITLNNARILASHVSTPVMAASGIDLDNVRRALESGAAAVGVGRAVSALPTMDAMVERIERMMLEVGRCAHAPFLSPYAASARA
ncbi:MAG: DUF561 domain-containing protein [Vampirovibrionales bacterium]|nr:DUF561 domain-containing protein [Vampirovibrionales bacterium]